ncbi:MAG TPA: ArsA family ATPase [Thermoanaerobaculia bacterium]
MLRLFGGKGGVGKTTCACASALAAAESGRRVLLVSTDPAHSLGDALAVPLSGDPTSVKTRCGELLAAELAAGPALERWKAAHRETLRAIAARGTYLDEEDVDRFLDLSPPGMDELIAWIELLRLARETGCQELVVDAAPTAHTLRLLEMPDALRSFARVLDRLQGRHREMAERFGGAYRPDEADALIEDLEREAEEIRERLRDAEKTALVWVMLPEALSIEETRDALAALEEMGLRAREIVVNRVTGGEGAAIGEIQEVFAEYEIRYLPEVEKEPRGVAALRRLPPPGPSPPGPIDPAWARPLPPSLTGRGGTRSGPALPWLEEIVPSGTRLLLFGGKGGVGKTTCSAAVALALAEQRKVLLISTDPAHSLGDVLEMPLGDDERALPGGSLWARELDTGRAFADWRARHGEQVEEAVGAFTGVGDLMDLTPPGLDELIAVSTLLDAVEGEAYDLVVVDTAPTGHALRLLEMPALALSWDHYLLSLLLKYREAVGLGPLASELVDLSRSLKGLQALLRDPGRTRFVAVTRDAELPRLETVRLLAALGELEIAVPAVIVNAVPLPAGNGLSRAGFEGCVIIKAPAELPPPRGIRRLSGWVRDWERETE